MERQIKNLWHDPRDSRATWGDRRISDRVELKREIAQLCQAAVKPLGVF